MNNDEILILTVIFANAVVMAAKPIRTVYTAAQDEDEEREKESERKNKTKAKRSANKIARRLAWWNFDATRGNYTYVLGGRHRDAAVLRVRGVGDGVASL